MDSAALTAGSLRSRNGSRLFTIGRVDGIARGLERLGPSSPCPLVVWPLNP